MAKGLKILLKDAKSAGKKTATTLSGGEILGLVGPLGSGKTLYTKALGKALGIKKVMPSPTFVLMHWYKARLKNKKPIILYHLDLYRAKNFREVKALGVEEFWGDKKTITVIEWADKIKKSLPKKTNLIRFLHN